MLLFLRLVFLTCTVYSITIPEEKVGTKKKVSTPGIKTIQWQEQETPQTGLFEDEERDNFKGQLQVGGKHDLFQIIEAEHTHQQELEEFEKEYGSSNVVQQQSVYSKKPEAYSKCPKMMTGPVPYVSSCSQFLNCYKGRGYVQNCAPGTLFNAYTLECDFASKVKCLYESAHEDYTQQSLTRLNLKTGCPSGFSGIVPHHYDCAKFITCDHGREIVMNCGPGTLFNLKINTCDYPNHAECASWSSKFEPNQATHQESREHSYYQKPPPVHTYNQHKPQCPRDVVGLHPHPTDCSKFLNCANGQTFIQDCGPGTVFNPKLMVCDFPYNVNCETHEEYRPDIDVRTQPKYEQVAESKGQETLSCPPNAYGLYPYPHVCFKFISCVEGETTILACPKGLVFNIASRECDYTYNVDCTRKGMKNIWAIGQQQKWNQQEVDQQQQGTNQWAQQSFDKTQPTDQGYNQWNQGGYNQNTNQWNHGGQQQTTGQGGYNQMEDNSQQSTNQWVDQWNQKPTSHGQTDNNQHATSQGGNTGPAYNQWNQKPTTQGRPGGQQQTIGQGGYNQIDDNSQQSTNQWVNQWNQKPTGPGQTDINQHTTNQGGYQKPTAQGKPGGQQQTIGQGGYNQIEDISQQNTNQWVDQWNQKPTGHGQTDINQYTTNQGGYQTPTAQGKPGGQQQTIGQGGYNQIADNSQQSTNQWNQKPTGHGQTDINQHETHQGGYTDQWNQKPTAQGKPGGQQGGYNQIADNSQQSANQWVDQWNQKPAGHGQTDINQHTTNQGGYQGKPGGQPQTTGQNADRTQQSTGQDFNKWNQNPTTIGPQTHQWNQQNTGHGQNQLPEQSGNGYNKWNTGDNGQKPGQVKGQKNQNLKQEDQNKIQGSKPKPAKPFANYKFKDNCSILDFYCTPTQCIPKSMHCDGVVDCPNGDDEQNCDSMLNQFEATPNHILAVREKEKFSNVTMLNCARSCLDSKGFQCRSFSYRKDDGCCFLSDGNVGTTGALILSYAYDYFEMNALSMNCSNLHVCPNKKCIAKKQICDGVNDCGDRTDEKGCSAKAFGYEIRLANGEKKDEGRLEIKAFGRVGYVCDDKFGLRNAGVACKELGFPLGALEVKGNSYYAKDLDEDVFYMMDDVICLGNETSLRDCDFNGWGVSNCEAQEIVGVVCKTPQENCPKDHWKCDTVHECLPLSFVCDGVNDCTDESDEASQHCDAPTELRLVDGKTKYEGRVEVRHHGIWGTVCDDDFNEDAAKVVCKYLGYPGKAVSKKDGTFGPGTGPIWLDQVFCQGNESALQYCVHWNWGEHNCEHSEDVGVVCSNIAPEYPEVVAAERNAHVENLPESVFMDQCGLRKDAMFLTDTEVHFRVIGGAVATRGDYPWQASLRIKNQSKMTHWCGAIVISKKFILTAAHCLQGYSKGAYVVVAGDYNTDEDEGTEQEAFIEEFYIHEDFRKGQKMNNDVAIIKLKGDGFRLTRDVQPICLPDKDIAYETGLNCTISGFGTIQSGKSLYSHDMRAAWIPLIDQEVCRMPHVYGNTITDGMICAGTLNEGADACEGDSGGPLACLHDGFYTLYGIVSWGHHCGHANKPGVYVRVEKYRKWIDDTILKHI